MHFLSEGLITASLGPSLPLTPPTLLVDVLVCPAGCVSILRGSRGQATGCVRLRAQQGQAQQGPGCDSAGSGSGSEHKYVRTQKNKHARRNITERTREKQAPHMPGASMLVLSVGACFSVFCSLLLRPSRQGGSLPKRRKQTAGGPTEELRASCARQAEGGVYRWCV